MTRFIFLNLKRFDISTAHAGVNSLAPMRLWATDIVTACGQGLAGLPSVGEGAWEFPIFFPEAHLLGAAAALAGTALPGAVGHPLSIGCQSVHRADTGTGKNFGAFTSSLTANAAVELGCTWTIIGHSEERAKLLYPLQRADVPHEVAHQVVHTILNEEIRMARSAGLSVLYCIGEQDFEVANRKSVLENQISSGLGDIDRTNIVLAYEPIWAIGPGKTPPTADQIAHTANLIKQLSAVPLVYGGGLKKENAQAIGGIRELDGGLIALTRFSGDIGFYPDEYLEIVGLYAQGASR
jgi:triosephosphate isomerase